jgi:hypothetical protein
LLRPRSKGNRREDTFTGVLDGLGFYAVASRGSAGIDVFASHRKSLQCVAAEVGGAGKRLRASFEALRACCPPDGTLYVVARECNIRGRVTWRIAYEGSREYGEAIKRAFLDAYPGPPPRAPRRGKSATRKGAARSALSQSGGGVPRASEPGATQSDHAREARQRAKKAKEAPETAQAVFEVRAKAAGRKAAKARREG